MVVGGESRETTIRTIFQLSMRGVAREREREKEREEKRESRRESMREEKSSEELTELHTAA